MSRKGIKPDTVDRIFRLLWAFLLAFFIVLAYYAFHE